MTNSPIVTTGRQPTIPAHQSQGTTKSTAPATPSPRLLSIATIITTVQTLADRKMRSDHLPTQHWSQTVPSSVATSIIANHCRLQRRPETKPLSVVCFLDQSSRRNRNIAGRLLPSTQTTSQTKQCHQRQASTPGYSIRCQSP